MPKENFKWEDYIEFGDDVFVESEGSDGKVGSLDGVDLNTLKGLEGEESSVAEATTKSSSYSLDNTDRANIHTV